MTRSRTRLTPRHPRRRVAAAALTALLLAACGEAGPFPITQVADQPRARSFVPPNGTDAFRLRISTQLPSLEIFDYELPEGWTSLKPTRMRNPNFVVEGAKDLEAYVTVIRPKAGNTVNNNLARWYKQMSRDPESVTQEVIDGLEKKPFLGDPASFVSLSGTYIARVGATPKKDMTLIGFLREFPRAFVTFKMLGPQDAVAAHQADFLKVAASLKLKAAPPPGSSHAGRARPKPLRWTAPEGWEAEKTNMYLLAAFRPKAYPDARCTVSFAGGGLLLNVNRWRRDQFGLKTITQADLDQLPRREVLGKKAHVIKLDGDFVGAMGQPPLPDARLLGLILDRAGQLLFVKMIGPRDAMEKEEDNFFALCDSLKEES